MSESVAAYQGGERDAALRSFLCVGERRCSEAGGGGIRALLEDLREAENARLGACAVGLERLRVGQQVGKPLADRLGHLDRHLPRPGCELAGDGPQNLIPGAPLPAVPLRLHARNRTGARLADCRNATNVQGPAGGTRRVLPGWRAYGADQPWPTHARARGSARLLQPKTVSHTQIDFQKEQR